MAHLKKINKVFYVRWIEYVDGKPMTKARSLGTRYKDIATKMLNELTRLHDMGEFEYNDPSLDIKSLLAKEDKPKSTVRVRTCREAVNAFYEYKSSLWTPQTMKTYKHVLEYWLNTGDVENKPVRSLQAAHIRPAIFRKGIKATTMHHYYRHMKSLWTYLLAMGIAKTDLVSPLKKQIPQKRDNTRPKMLTSEEFELLIETFEKDLERKQSTYSYDKSLVQNWFIPLISLYFFAGLRRSEVAYDGKISYSGLKAENLIYQNGTLKFIALPPTKGRTERIVPISPKLREYLEPYLKQRGTIYPGDYVFVYNGGQYKGEPVRAKKVYEVFNKYLKIAGIPSTRTLHGMRHSAVTSWIEQGFNTAEAQIMAGHSSITVTEGYTHLTAERLYQKMDAMR
ncbi:MAG: phage integrase [Bacteroidetes bacterium HLUCCA01]|nr:MAG: phage integrase [Bacteroidetes bacterium HLUCCA01]